VPVTLTSTIASRRSSDTPMSDTAAVCTTACTPAAVLDERRLVAQVALDHLAAEPQQVVGAAAVADERPHLVTALAEQAGDLAAEEAGRTGQEDAHRADSTRSPWPARDCDVIRSCPLRSVRPQERCVME
jgi:hypothetical protein